jgi:hypothetical protein
MAEIRIDVRDAQRMLIRAAAELSAAKVKLSISRAINSALGKTQTLAIRAITARYNLKYGQVAKKLFMVRASPVSPYRGYLKVYNQPFLLSAFNPREIRHGVATARMSEKGNISRRGHFQSKRVAGLRANKMLVRNGLIVQVIKGQDAVLKSATLAFRQGRTNASVSARGQYGNRGFEFDAGQKNKSLRGIGVGSALRSNNVAPMVREYAENEYLLLLSKELRKRIKGIGEQHARLR